MDLNGVFNPKITSVTRFRTLYPTTLMEYLIQEIGIKGSIVADIGAGYGCFTRQIAPHVGLIYAVEPDDDRRKECRQTCYLHKHFMPVNGTAEKTNLPNNLFNYVISSEVFHKFQVEETIKEFRRILKPDGSVIFIYNSRIPSDIYFDQNDKILNKYCPNFPGFYWVSQAQEDAAIEFFGDNYEHRFFDTQEWVNLSDFLAINMSSYYALKKKDYDYHKLVSELELLFNEYSERDKLLLTTRTHCYIGQF